MCIIHPWLLDSSLVHSDTVLTENGCSRGATEGKVVFCHSGGGGPGEREGVRGNKVCVHTESNKWSDVF